MEIKTISGKFKITVWHVGQKIMADLNGFNWVIENERLTRVIEALQKNSETKLYSHRSLVTITNQTDQVVIKGKDTAFMTDGCTVILNSTGREEFIAALQQALAKRRLPSDYYGKEYTEYLRKIEEGDCDR